MLIRVFQILSCVRYAIRYLSLVTLIIMKILENVLLSTSKMVTIRDKVTELANGLLTGVNVSLYEDLSLNRFAMSIN